MDMEPATKEDLRELKNDLIEMDETFMGGKESAKHESKKLRQGRGTVGKTPVVGIKDWPTKQVVAQAVEDTGKETLHSIAHEHINDETGT